jgi:oligopeptide transport system substrate-binding protein
VAAVLLALAPAGCDNSPYPDSDEGQKVLYGTFDEEPKHLDPAQSYSAGEGAMMWQVLEPPLQYHYLKRPYTLDPLTAREIPKAQVRDVEFQGKTVQATVYTVAIQPGIRYQNHPCFVAANRCLADQDLAGLMDPADLPAKATRELTADDYVFAVRRLADPRLACPIFATLSANMLGLEEYQAQLQQALDERRAERRQAGGAFYNQEQDEKYNPIPLDYAAGAERFPFIRPVDRHTFEVVLQHPYPQMLYWMAMTFFAPVPPEAAEFYDQPAVRRTGITLDNTLVGTGAFRLGEYDPTNEIVFVRNENYRDVRYPSLAPPSPGTPEGNPPGAAGGLLERENYQAMKAAGMLQDTGKRLPMIDRLVRRMEKESVPRWNKFLQGYYDSSGIGSDQFDQAVRMTSRGDPALTDELTERGIRLLTSSSVSVSYYAFNMNDPVFGGYTEPKRKLRQAISVAFDIEEEVTIFRNGQGIPAQGPVPPGIFGYEEGQAGLNGLVYRWDAKLNHPVRRSLEEAKKLLAEAGYPGGYGPDGKALSVHFATGATDAEDQSLLKFIRKQFDKLNIRLIVEATDYNRFQDKVKSGNFQFLHWGWIADYPDPENFLFLLYGPNGKGVSGGENVPNYKNPEYDRLFQQMQSMDNTPQRLEIIRKMLALLRQDSPWIWGYYPLDFDLYHDWDHNAYPNALAYNTAKYARLDSAARAAYRRKYNTPQWQPVAIFAAVLVVLTIPAVRVAARHFREA